MLLTAALFCSVESLSIRLDPETPLAFTGATRTALIERIASHFQGVVSEVRLDLAEELARDASEQLRATRWTLLRASLAASNGELVAWVRGQQS